MQEQHQEQQESSKVIFEGYLSKQSSRKRGWSKRYFVLSADSNLSYYKVEDGSSETNPALRKQTKKSCMVDKNHGCEIGNLYVDERQWVGKKELMYCMKLTWSQPSDALSSEEPNDVAAADGGANGDYLTSPIQSLDDCSDAPMRKPIPVGQCNNVPLTPSERGDFTTEGDTYDEIPISAGTAATTVSPTKKNKQKIWSLKNGRKVLGAAVEKKVLASLAPPLTNATGNTENPNIRTSTKIDTLPTSSETSKNITRSNNNSSPEQDILRSEYLSKQKKIYKKAKNKVIKGAKYTAAVGVGTATAIILGPMLGLAPLAVGVAAASGSGAGAAGVALRLTGKKKIYELVIGTENYEQAKIWKTTLDAYLQYEVIQETTWGEMFVNRGNHSKSTFIPGVSSAFTSQQKHLHQPYKQQQQQQHTEINKNSISIPNAAAQFSALQGGCWSPISDFGTQGLRIFRLEKELNTLALQDPLLRRRGAFANLSADGPPCPPMKARMVLSTTPLNAFLCLMSNGQIMPTNTDNSGNGTDGIYSSSAMMNTPKSEQGSSFRIVETVSDNMDIIQLTFRPIYLFPSWTSPRDYVLVRYWRMEPDGSYVVCYDSVKHRDCPARPEFVRGEMHQVFTIAPRKCSRKQQSKQQRPQRLDSLLPPPSLSSSTSFVDGFHYFECLLSAVVQVDPKGWVPTITVPSLPLSGYGNAFGANALWQLLDIRDAIDNDRFTPIPLDNITTNTAIQRKPSSTPQLGEESLEGEIIHDDLVNYDFSYSFQASLREPGASLSMAGAMYKGFLSNPPSLDSAHWAEPDANSFRVRGPNYLNDRKKINAGSSIARLLTVDLIEVEEYLYTGISDHPKERIQLALKNNDLPPFVFLLNILIPGPPHYHIIFYYAIDDMSTIDGSDGMPSSLLCKQFFFGDSDDFRDQTFKLIPQIMEGNFLVRKAVGSTPAIVGKKLRSVYIQKDRYFELIIDVASYSVAAGIVGISRGYASTLVIDLGFLFEGSEDEHLPEKILATGQLRNLDLSKGRKLGCSH